MWGCTVTSAPPEFEANAPSWLMLNGALFGLFHANV